MSMSLGSVKRGELQTERLVLRALCEGDFEVVHSWAGSSQNARYMSWGPNTPQQTREFLQGAQEGCDFAVMLKETGELIGSCGIYPDDDNDTGKLGWILHKDYWGRGFGTELCGELLRYGFEDLRLRRICAECMVVNVGSWKVMEHNGMRREALRKQAFLARVDKVWADVAEYALLASEYWAR